MPTFVRDPPPIEFEALLERRRRIGRDLLVEAVVERPVTLATGVCVVKVVQP